jgi:hypothetical protein
MNAADPNARARPNRSRLSPASWIVRVSASGISPAVPTAMTDSAAAIETGSEATPSHAAPAAATAQATNSGRLITPARSAIAPQAGAATRPTTAFRASSNPIEARSRPRDASSTDWYGNHEPTAANSAT